MINIKTIAIYARVSLPTIRDTNTEMDYNKRWQEAENQLRQLREFASQQKWIIYKEYVDKKSGKTAEREEFSKMFLAAYQRKFDLILFWSLDRFSREGAYETLQHLQKLSSYKVYWKSYTEQYLDSCGVFGDAVIAILATIAKQERIRISERIKAGIARARAEGNPRYKNVDVEMIISMWKEGKSKREIAKKVRVSRATVIRKLREAEII